ncbi:MAG: helix-turn-helix transcriptional regulator [Chloroflexi bacterium]|nr:helix-turn-helix transcriptional regulator [Chloroflexota bacterium]
MAATPSFFDLTKPGEVKVNQSVIDRGDTDNAETFEDDAHIVRASDLFDIQSNTENYEEEVWTREDLAKLAMNWAQTLQGKDSQDISKELEELGAKISGLVVLPEAYNDDTNLTVLSHAIYQALREAMAQNTFKQTEGSPWPTAELKKGGASGHAQLRPPLVENGPLMPPDKAEALAKIMWEQQKDLSDLDADALDLLSHIWLQQARTPESFAVAHVDQFLAMRGLEQRWGRRKGYETQQRDKMLQVLSHIQNIWLNLGEVEIYETEGSGLNKGRRKAVKRALQSRAFIITDRMGQLRLDGYLDVERFIFQPGRLFAQFLFGPGRQTALLSTRAVQYDPYRQKWEKRLARYLSWQWRIQARHGDYARPYRVATLLEAVGEELNPRRASATRERLEKALDTLEKDEVISEWRYDRWDEDVAELRGWWLPWQQATILLEPPEIIRETYKTLDRHKPKEIAANRLRPQLVAPSENEKPGVDNVLAEKVKNMRKKLGLSQAEAAEQLGVVQSSLSRLERGIVTPTPDLLKRVEEWLNQ